MPQRPRPADTSWATIRHSTPPARRSSRSSLRIWRSRRTGHSDRTCSPRGSGSAAARRAAAQVTRLAFDAPAPPTYDRCGLVRLRVWALAALLVAALLAFAPRGLAAPAPPAPTAGKTVVVARVSGVVKVRLPGEPGFSALHGARVVPLRTIVDALRGVVRLTSADGSGLFYQGIFQVFEPKVAPAGAGRDGSPISISSAATSAAAHGSSPAAVRPP